jgi:rubrerythrin
MNEELFYLQDSRSYVGNDILWWAKKGMGYTTDLTKAEVYTKEQAVRQHQCRETDRPWPKSYIDQHTRPAVDMQYVEINKALKGTGIKLIKPRKLKKDVFNCHGCGRFLSERDIYSDCPNCGADNRP